MRRNHYILLFIGSLVFFSLISLIQKTPGYMDSAYYFATGRIIASGNITSEPFLWNYLNSPASLSSPIFSYWMPLAGILASLPMSLAGSGQFWVSRVLFILLSSLIPLLCVYFAAKFTQNAYILWLAAGFGIANGYYLPFLTIPETFALFMILGAIYFIFCEWIISDSGAANKKYLRWLILGGIAGLMHLTRADGILWLFGAVLLTIIIGWPLKMSFFRWMKQVFCILSAYLLVMAGWFIRNLTVYHSLFPAGSNLSLRMTEYNDLFIFPASELTWTRWLQSGWASILGVRTQALLDNLQNIIGVMGGIMLFPFLVVGMWKLRKNRLIQFALLMFLIIFCAMTFIFPFAGARGGFFHSASAFQVLFWAVAAFGFEKSITWVAGKRKWKTEKSIPLLGTTLIICLAIISSLAFYIKVNGVGNIHPTWDSPAWQYTLIDDYLKTTEGDSSSPIMINDSPGYYAATDRPAIQLLKADLKTSLAAMEQFDVRFLVIANDHTDALAPLYNQPGDQSGLLLIGEIEGNYIYEYPR